jgi:ribosomal 50S subunit-recycling heat shock protein
VRLDVFLKRTGLIRQRSLAKDICDNGRVKMDGTITKAGKEIGPGRRLEIDLATERLEIEVLDLPPRNYKKEAGRAFYRTIEHEYKDRYS